MFKRFLPVAAVLAVASTPVFAHHSAAQFDFTRNDELTGTVRLIEVINPHMRLILNVADKKGGHEVVFEGHSRNNFFRAGWRAGSIKVGDRITVHFAPTRDTSEGGYVREIITASGKKIG